MDHYESKYKESDYSNSSPSVEENFHQNLVIEPLNYPNFENNIRPHQEDNQYHQQIGSNQIRQEIQQPLVVPYVPINQGNIDLNFQKRILLQKLNKLLIYQQLFQVFLPLICYLFGTFDKLFGRFFLSEHEINVCAWLIIIHTLMYLLIVRFNTSIRTNQNRCIYSIFFILYSLCINSIILFYEYEFGDFLALISLVDLIMLIQYQVQLEKLKQSNLNLISNNQNDLAFLINTCYGVFFLLLIWLSLDTYYHDYRDFGFSVLFFVLWPFVFTLFYVSSLLQVYNGKFQLGPQQEHIGSVLVITNMFLLCVPDL